MVPPVGTSYSPGRHKGDGGSQRLGRGRNGELVANGDRVSVWGEGKEFWRWRVVTALTPPGSALCTGHSGELYMYFM